MVFLISLHLSEGLFKHLFSIKTDHSINVTDGCTPFRLRVKVTSTWNVTSLGCQSVTSKEIQLGRTKYTIISQLVDPTGNLYNYTTELPPTLTFQVVFGNNFV